jgi:hypothetical protein
MISVESLGFCIITELVGIHYTEFLVWYNTMDCASVCVCVCVCARVRARARACARACAACARARLGVCACVHARARVCVCARAGVQYQAHEINPPVQIHHRWPQQ